MVLQKESEQPTLKRQTAQFIKIGIGIFLVALVLEVWMVNRLSTAGRELQDIKDTKARLETENQLLSNEIARNISLARLEEEATLMGFTANKTLEYLKPDMLSVASRETP